MATNFTREQFDTFLGGLKFPPNPFQLKVLESIAFGSGNITVSALAGSGKTSLLVQTAYLLNQMSEASSLYMAFNVKIRDELNERLPKPHIATNSHRLGLQVLNATRKSMVDNMKWRNLCEQIIEGEFFDRSETYRKRRALESLCSKVMLNYVDTGDHIAIAFIARHYRIEGVYDSEEDRFDDRMIRLVKKAVDKALDIWQNTGAISFDEMLYIPVVKNLQPTQYRWVFVDECQDLNILQQELAYRSVMSDGRMIFVGDKHQCQPPGTLVKMADGRELPIEAVQAGDRVVSYDRRSGHWMRRAVVKQTACREYKGWMYYVTAATKTSRATDNHKWLVRWENTATNKWITYIMRRGDQYRVGIVQMFNNIQSRRDNKEFGLSARMRSEGADAGWVIGIHDDYIQAYTHEQIVAARYGMPQLTFRTTNGSRLTQLQIDYIHTSIGDTTEKASDCLFDHGRNIDYPLIDRNNEQQRRGGSTYFVTESCNLIPGFMAIPVAPEPITFHPKTPFKTDFQVIEVSQARYHGQVYSLEVDRYELYVADGLLTHNSIYGFAGADAASFERIIERTKSEVLPLNTCYRCPTTHIELAKKLVPELEPAPNATAGVIEYAKEEDLYKLAQKGSLVMCRLNAPLISAYFSLIANRIPAKVMGKDIGQDLIRTLDRVAELDGFEYDEAVRYLDQYRNQQIRVLSQKEGSESQIEILQDKIECLIVCVENFNCQTLQCLKDVMLDLFGDDDKENWKNMVALCTVHKAKGLEADETFILRPDKMPLTWPGQQQWEAEQELNIRYVALTRSKKRMTILGEPMQMESKPLPIAESCPKWNAPLAEMLEPRGDEAIKTAEQEPSMARLVNSKGVDIETGEIVQPEPAPAPRVTGNLKADLKAFAEQPSPKPEPATVQDDSGIVWKATELPAEVEKEVRARGTGDVEITPVTVPAPRRTLDEIVSSLTIAEIDRMIEVLQAARDKKVVQDAT